VYLIDGDLYYCILSLGNAHRQKRKDLVNLFKLMHKSKYIHSHLSKVWAW